jgi:murein DD-endopeptidase MepM/ murein hydrolase activator NlpD
MFDTPVNISARRMRLQKLRGSCKLSPRKKLVLQALVVIVALVVSPILSPDSSAGELVAANFDTGELLAIDSATFTLDVLNATEDGFLIKGAGQTADIDRSDLSDIISYTVEEGDALSSIARRFSVSTDTIIWENGITDPHRLKPGTVLRILPVSGITHAVAQGDTLESLAKKYSLDAEKLAKQNQLTKESTLIAGTKLIVPGGKKIVNTGPVYLASNSAPGVYAAYTPPKTIDGSIIIANGQKEKHGKWMVKPTVGKYTTYFGGRRGHWAVDIADRSKPAISAAASGTVVKSQCGWNGGYGCVVVIDHGDGFQTLYGHLSEISISVGDAVDQGQRIGTMGNTGRVYGATGIHLHFEVIDNGAKKNPLAFYSE